MGGCVAASASRWWNPSTWFSGSELRTVQATAVKVDSTKDAAIKAAQKTAHETGEALAAAPTSRPVEVATESNAQTISLLDQVSGPLSVKESNDLRARIAGLLSENAQIRATAEKERDAERGKAAKVSTQLAELTDRFASQSKDLQLAFARENAVANSYRNLKWGFAGLALVTIIGYVGLLYLRATYGGILPAVGKALFSLRTAHPEAGDLATSVLDAALSPAQQAKIARHA